LTITPQPRRDASASAGPADGSSRFQVACTEANGLVPSTSAARARSSASRCRGPLVVRPITCPASRRRASSCSTAVSSSTPLSSVAEWIW
jgi:hypothetical protein